jgi:FkbM family methyltransferase
MQALLLDEHLALVTGRDGYFLINRHDRYIGQALEQYGEYSAQESDFLVSLVRQGDMVVEVGANIGAHTVGLARQVGASGRVVAFEPQRACYALLQAQVALNQLDNVNAYWSALGQRRGELWVPAAKYSESGNFGGIALTDVPQEDGEKVSVGTLDEFLPSENVTLLKIDVEGMEREVLEGGLGLLERAQPLLYVENDRVHRSKALIDLLLDHDYRLYWHLPPLYNPDNHFRNHQNVYGNLVSCNMLGVPSSRSVEQAAPLREIFSSAAPHPFGALGK